jgi:hypothetical protein
VTAALVAGGYAFFKYTAAGAQALSSLGGWFGQLKATALTTFKGISDALQGGSLALAGRVAMAGLNVEWLKGTNALQAIWIDWSTAFKTVLSGASFAVAKSFVSTWASIQTGAITAVGAIRDVWTVAVGSLAQQFAGLMGSLTKLWNGFTAIFREGWLQIENVLKGGFSTASRKAISDRIGGELATANAGVDARTSQALDTIRGDTAATLEGRSKERQGRIDAIQGGAQQQLGILDQNQTTANEERFAAARESMKGLDKNLADAMAELNSALEDAKFLASTTPANPTALRLAGAGAGGLTPEGLDAGLATAKATTEVKGSFSASAIRSRGFGDSVADAVKQASRKTDTTNAQLMKLNRNVEQSGRLT